ncbi:TCEB3 (predicted) [Pycnogonum litorale]
MYLRLCDEREAKLKAITANISASMAKATPVRQTKLAYVDTVAKPPRDVARRQARQGTGIPVGMPMKSGPPGQATQRPKIHSVNTPAPTSSSNNSHKKMKSVAPLMQKTLKLMKNRFRR